MNVEFIMQLVSASDLFIPHQIHLREKLNSLKKNKISFSFF